MEVGNTIRHATQLIVALSKAVLSTLSRTWNSEHILTSGATYATPNESAVATPVSPPKYIDMTDEYWQYVDYRGGLFRIYWPASNDAPHLLDFPHAAGCRVEVVKMSQAMSREWRGTTVVDFGADSFLRHKDSDPLPIRKLAHPDSSSRNRLRYEFEMMKVIAALSLPIPEFHKLPLLDEHGIYGYRMEKLHKLDFDRLEDYAGQVESVLDQFHRAEISHGDIHMGNVMLDEYGKVKFIDFSYAGRIGDPIPSSIPFSIYESPNFHGQVDKERMRRCFPVPVGKPHLDAISRPPSPVILP